MHILIPQQAKELKFLEINSLHLQRPERGSGKDIYSLYFSPIRAPALAIFSRYAVVCYSKWL
jgi:hypothetical protein